MSLSQNALCALKDRRDIVRDGHYDRRDCGIGNVLKPPVSVSRRLFVGRLVEEISHRAIKLLRASKKLGPLDLRAVLDHTNTERVTLINSIRLVRVLAAMSPIFDQRLRLEEKGMCR